MRDLAQHRDNGSGWCVGCPIDKDPKWPEGDGRCTVRTRHCPVLNTPEQLAEHRLEDRNHEIVVAQRNVDLAQNNLTLAEQALARAQAHERENCACGKPHNREDFL